VTHSELLAFPPHVLREYSLLADGHRGALCDPRGNIAWLCAPQWHDDAICATLIGGRGAYAITPSERHVWGGYYEPGTLIWRSRWVTDDGAVESRDALAYPADPAHLILLRRVEALDEDTSVDVVLDLRAGFGSRSMRQIRRIDSTTWTARTGDLFIRWTGVRDARERDEGGLAIRTVVPVGSPLDLVLEVSPDRLPDTPPDPDVLWSATEHSWLSVVPEFSDSISPRDARHAYAVMRGLTSPGGGMVAAATLGLPERAEAGRNYDYRYVWLRDQAYAGLGVSVNEPHPLLDDAIAFATKRLLEHGADIAPAYTIDGDPLPSESDLSLPGYPGGRDVVGNWVNGQFQLDTIGELLSLFATGLRHDRLDTDSFRAMTIAADVIEQKWTAPDAGIWELNNDWWSQSRLACVAGLRSAAAQLPVHDGVRMTALADAIMAETSRRCLNPSGYWQRTPDDPTTDASLLLPPVRGALPPDDPRTLSTLRQVDSALTDDGYVYRFSSDDRPLGEAEGAFLLCGFSMALATWQQGDLTTAFRWFERNRAACGTPGLFAEEYEVQQRQLRGNLPQAFIHAALLEASLRLATPPPTGTAP
jgi:Glycosyl hydrolases family 15/Trehalase-like, N-terminal